MEELTGLLASLVVALTGPVVVLAGQVVVLLPGPVVALAGLALNMVGNASMFSDWFQQAAWHPKCEAVHVRQNSRRAKGRRPQEMAFT